MRETNLPKRATVIETLLSKWEPEEKTEIINLEDGLNRILYEDLLSRVNIPYKRASAMDGVGLISSMFQNGMPDTSEWVKGREYVRADTGDDFDDKYDAVVPIEQVQLSDEKLSFINTVEVTKGLNIRPMGSSIAKGEILAKKYTRLTPSDLAAIAAGGVAEIRVIKKPVVAFIPTGNELVPLGEMPERGKTIDSNTVLVKNMLIQTGALPLCFSIVRDDKSLLEKALDDALKQADIIILNAGSSKGEDDYNFGLLEERGEVLFHWVAAAPGKPMCVALVDQKPVINIPGPPVAAYYGTDWCIRAAVNKMLKQKMPVRKTIKARLTEEIRFSPDMEILCKMEIHRTKDGYETRQIPFRASSVVENLTAPGHFITEIGRGRYLVNEVLDVELLRDENEL